MKQSLCILVLILAHADVMLAMKTLAQKVMDSSDVSMEGPDPWLGLLASTWSLSSSHNAEVGLKHLKEQLLALSKSKNFLKAMQNPEMVTTVSEIKKLLEDMKRSINQSSIDAQIQLNNAYANFRECVVPMSNGPTPSFEYYSYTRSIVFTNPSKVIADEITCLTKIRTDYGQFQACNETLQYCILPRADCCNNLIQEEGCLNITPPSAPVGLCDQKSTCNLNDMQGLLTSLTQRLADYQAAKTKCKAAQDLCTNPYDPPNSNCDDALSQVELDIIECTRIERILESGYCSVASASNSLWNSYNDCYNSKKTYLQDKTTLQQKLQVQRQEEWVGILQIDCLLNAILSPDVPAALQNCTVTTPDPSLYAFLALAYRMAPNQEQCQTLLTDPTSYGFLISTYGADNAKMIQQNLTSSKCFENLGPTVCPVRTYGIVSPTALD